MAYLCHHYEPDSNTELVRMQQRSIVYQIIRDELYKTSVTGGSNVDAVGFGKLNLCL
jgi:hypothetical protein